jgi:outer membrane lipoprotein-sorting protein
MSMRITAVLAVLLSVVAARAEFPLKADATLDRTLDALHQVGRDLKDFTADVTLGTTDPKTGEESKQHGRVVYQKYKNANGEDDTRIRVTFEKKEMEGGVTINQKLDYKLEDAWLTDRDYQKKLEVRRQVLRPGQKMNLLKLGEGPFPLPIGQDKEAVKKEFEASKEAAKADDPKDAIHLKLVPKKDTRLAKRFTKLDVYVDQQTGMPRRIDATEKVGAMRTTELKNVKLNGGVQDADFALDNIEGKGWNRREEPYE